MLPAAPAFAADQLICVNSPAGVTCDLSAPTIPAAIAAANANVVDDTILVAPGIYDDGPYQLNGTAHAITLKGSGEGETILTLPPSATEQEYVQANHASVQDLTIQMAPGADSTNDEGLRLFNGATVDRVTVDGAGTQDTTGIQAAAAAISAATITMPITAGTRGIYGEGGVTVTNSTISGNTGYAHSGVANPDALAGVAIQAAYQGVSTDSGTVVLENALIDLGTSNGSGLAAVNGNASTSPKAIDANHVTIVGGGAGSEGAYAEAANPNALQQSTIELDNSIVSGPAVDLAVLAGNNGSQGGPSTATITTSYSVWSTTSENATANGTATVTAGTGDLEDVDPGFADPAEGDYRLTPASPVVDLGDPAPGGPALDLDGAQRVYDGDLDGTAVRDPGAFELGDTVAPDTAFTTTPAKRVTKRKVRFGFSATEGGSTFSCRLDGKQWRSCTSPRTVRVAVGRHRFSVRATDEAGNDDATPVSYRFRRARR